MKKKDKFNLSELINPIRKSLGHQILSIDQLYKNSFFIYLSTIAGASIGFFFWMIAARLYSAENIGITSALVSSAGIIASLSNFGFYSAIIRFLPSSDKRDELFNSAWLASLVIGLLIGLLFIGGIDIFSPSLQFLKDTGVAFAFLLFLMLEISIAYTSAALLSLRKAEYFFAQNLGFGTRILLLIPMTFVGVLGIFGSILIAYIISFAVGLSLLIRAGIKIKPAFSCNALNGVLKFSLANYANDFLFIAENSVLPIMILNMIGAKEAGYFYVAFSIASLLYAIPNSIFSSMFVEGSHGEPLKRIISQSIRFVLVFLIPCGIILYLGGGILLSLFGHEYYENAYDLLKVLTISGIFVAINSMFTASKKIEKNLKSLIFINMLIFILIVSLSYFFIMRFGVIGVGFGWAAGHGITAIIVVIMMVSSYRYPSKDNNTL